jgi:hypothetical protein
MTIPAFSGKGLMTACSKNNSLRDKVRWGFCMRLPASMIGFQVPNAVTEVEEGQSFVWVANGTSNPVSIHKGEPVACFVEGKREEYDLFAIDLETMKWKEAWSADQQLKEDGRKEKPAGEEQVLEDGEICDIGDQDKVSLGGRLTYGGPFSIDAEQIYGGTVDSGCLPGYGGMYGEGCDTLRTSGSVRFEEGRVGLDTLETSGSVGPGRGRKGPIATEKKGLLRRAQDGKSRSEGEAGPSTGASTHVEGTKPDSSPGARMGSPGSVSENDLRVPMGTPGDTQGDFSTARPQQLNRALEERSADRHSGEGGLHPKNRLGDFDVVDSQSGKSRARPEGRTEELHNIAEVLQSKSSNVLGMGVPFENQGLNTAHLPRMDSEVVGRMTDSQVDAEIAGTPIEEILFPSSLYVEQVYVSKRLILLNRDVFARNDKSPAMCNANGVVLDTGTARPQVYPLRPTLPNMRPTCSKNPSLWCQKSGWGALEWEIPRYEKWGAP